MLFYRAAVDLSPQTLKYVGGLIRRHRKAVGTVWRRLSPGQQAMLVLVCLRKGETFRELGAGFGVSAATAWQVRRGDRGAAVGPLSETGARARKGAMGRTAPPRPGRNAHRTDRVRADRPYYSGKHRTHGMNVQVIASPEGALLWTSGALPGSVHDLVAARAWGILRRLEQTGLPVLADKAYQGAGGPVATPCKAIAVLQNYEVARG
ncbi:hypothetical protein Ssi02_57940 [Sinosporangium siamense]|uniref:DDE superfamily endonuclease n=1 Tax=Sinosporangium siamense TaxID=1367973 RepID=A0A919RKP7_9ACTN|nr:hypothetical protein Ssi02_57940 [Sinosporangium siamense]